EIRRGSAEPASTLDDDTRCCRGHLQQLHRHRQVGFVRGSRLDAPRVAKHTERELQLFQPGHSVARLNPTVVKEEENEDWKGERLIGRPKSWHHEPVKTPRMSSWILRRLSARQAGRKRSLSLI